MARSGKLCEHKLCKQCWKSAKQKRDSKNPKAAAAQEEKVKPDEASTLFVSSNLALSCQGIAGGKVRNKVKKVKVHTRIDNFVNISMAGSKEVTVASLGKEASAVVLDHHIFDSRIGWVRRNAWKQPSLRLSIRPCEEIYSKLNTHS